MITINSISQAVEQDAEELVHLINSAYRGESSKKGWTTEADLLDGIRIDEASILELLRKPGAVLLKSVNENDELVGCVYLQKQSDQLYLGMLTVSPELQAKGIGKQLLSAATAYAIQQHSSVITMNVISIRHELIAWYERHGYQQTGKTKPFAVDPRFGRPAQDLEFIVLEKAL